MHWVKEEEERPNKSMYVFVKNRREYKGAYVTMITKFDY